MKVIGWSELRVTKGHVATRGESTSSVDSLDSLNYIVRALPT